MAFAGVTRLPTVCHGVATRITPPCVVHVPEALPLELAFASMFHGLTAHYLAHDVGNLGPGVTCLVHSASDGIGQLLVQIGAQLGATIYATTSTEAKAQVARDRGATVAFLYDDGRLRSPQKLC